MPLSLRCWTLLLACVGTVACAASASNHRAVEAAWRPDLTRLPTGDGGRLVNRRAAPLIEGARRGVRLERARGDGMAWIDNVQFTDGSIELDIRGTDDFQRSFVGVAFRSESDSTYDVVYFRPFNFRSADANRRSHAVQYMSHPTYQWDRLRREHPGVYERPVDPAPDPNDWFHVRIEVEKPVVRVFVNGAVEPSLVVRELSTQRGGRIGLWVGTGSGGDFANLVIRPR